MAKPKNKCGQWGNFFAGDPVLYKDMRWRVVVEELKKVPKGHAPIKPEEEEAASITGIRTVPIDDLDRV